MNAFLLCSLMSVIMIACTLAVMVRPDLFEDE